MAMTRLKIPDGVEHYAVFMWLNEKFGKSGEKWKMVDLTYVVFEDTKDALYFSLRWPV
jgi:hypothetical protein